MEKELELAERVQPLPDDLDLMSPGIDYNMWQ